MQNIPNQIISDLKKARLSNKISQQELASKLSIPQSHLSKIESGKINPTISILIELSRNLGMELIVVPNKYIGAIEGLLRQQPKNSGVQEPAYQIDEDEDA